MSNAPMSLLLPLQSQKQNNTKCQRYLVGVGVRDVSALTHPPSPSFPERTAPGVEVEWEAGSPDRTTLMGSSRCWQRGCCYLSDPSRFSSPSIAAHVGSPWATCPGPQSLGVGFGSGSTSSSFPQPSPLLPKGSSCQYSFGCSTGTWLKLSYSVYSTYRKFNPYSANGGNTVWSFINSDLELFVGDKGNHQKQSVINSKEIHQSWK